MSQEEQDRVIHKEKSEEKIHSCGNACGKKGIPEAGLYEADA